WVPKRPSDADADGARDLGMSVSGFHHHFKSVTAMSPLQFQKQIRLQDARRLMLSEDLDAGSAGFRVGYEDPSYFSRDYKKQSALRLSGISRGNGGPSNHRRRIHALFRRRQANTGMPVASRR
ncbi:MAG TPA: AraC family transcriptional regulator, partial [Pyrinomonadaceae bacterium]